MKELSTEQIAEIRDEVFNAANPRAKAIELARQYTPEQVADALVIASPEELPTNNINAAETSGRRKPGPKPGAKKSPKPKAPAGESPAPVRPKTPKTIALTAETAAVLSRYLEGSLQRDVREGLGGGWTPNDLRELLNAQHALSTYGEDDHGQIRTVKNP
ncbi:MAG: hypothetical protein IJ347_09420 [Faecalibacterium sp.]|nr:hypothetical protein [Faecalibacterium sp.]